MTDRPIIFSAPMVRALLDGRGFAVSRGIRAVPDNGTWFPTLEAARLTAEAHRAAQIRWRW